MEVSRRASDCAANPARTLLIPHFDTCATKIDLSGGARTEISSIPARLPRRCNQIHVLYFQPSNEGISKEREETEGHAK